MEMFEKAAEAAPEATKRFVKKSFDIADRLYEILQAKGMTQKEFAKLIDKRESEVSKWLSGQHNFTIKTITAIEAALNEDLIEVSDGREFNLDYLTGGGQDEYYGMAADSSTEYQSSKKKKK